MHRLECVTNGVCPLYDEGVWGAPITVALDFYPIFLTVGMYAISLYQYELYFALVSLGLTANWGINVFLQHVVFKQLGAFAGCGSTYQMPSFSSQHIVMFNALMACYMMGWGKRFAGKLILLMQLFTAAVLVSRIFIGINTRAQLLVGGLLGFGLGVGYHCILYYLIYPRFGKILEWQWAQWVGIVDTLCGGNKELAAKYKKRLRSKSADRDDRRSADSVQRGRSRRRLGRDGIPMGDLGSAPSG